MTRLYVAIAAALFTAVFGATANAYETEPTYTLVDMTAQLTQIAQAGDICIPGMDPQLAKVLALPAWSPETDRSQVACATH